jgi:hypothetical protein
LKKKSTNFEAILGIVFIMSLLIGIVSFIAAVITFINGELISAGLFLIASALSFGMLTNAFLRR